MKRLTLLLTFVLMAGGAMQTALAAMPKIAILDSAYSAAYFGAHYRNCPGNNPDPYALGSNEYLRYQGGWIHVLTAMGLSSTTILDKDVTDAGLAPYDLLILSNSPSLSDDESKTIQKWVGGGGKLLATFGSGYKDIVPATDTYPIDTAKLEKGGTNGLHELWHDPQTKAVTTAEIEVDQFGSAFAASGADSFEKAFCGSTPICGTEVRVTNFSGPAKGLSPDPGFSYKQLTGYGDNGNTLVQRPVDSKDVFGVLVFKRNIVAPNPNPDNIIWNRPLPAILADSFSHGSVVYYAFAPEYIVGLEFDVAGHCPSDPNYFTIPNAFNGRTDTTYIPLMKDTITYLLNQ
jgi:hypothetical protein